MSKVMQFKPRARGQFQRWLIVGCLVGLVSACSSVSTPTPTPPPLAKELVLYNWVDYMPQSVLDAFEQEYGVKVTVLTYSSAEEAIAGIRSGLKFDVAVVDDNYVPSLIGDQLIARISHRQIPNLKNISANFFDLRYDPGNNYSMPYSWGTTGLLVRSDLIDGQVSRWADLWDPRYAGKIAVRAQPVELISVALKSLGYSLYSEKPAELEAALKRLQALKSAAFFVDVETEQAVAPLLTGEAVILIGWPGDALYARERNADIQYILPQEGTMLWGDRFVISRHSANQATGELFLNFLLRPDIGAQIINQNHYPLANEAAKQLGDPRVVNDPVIYPPVATISVADWYAPRSGDGEKLYDDIWARFMAAK